MTKRKAVRRITAGRQERINRLAEILYNFLPLSSYSKSATTFSTIFAESRVDSYLKGKNKTQALQTGLTELFRYHQRLPFTIVRKIVPASIEWRRQRRDPLRTDEIDALARCLFDLEVDMQKELGEIQLDETLPRITVPPKDLEDRLQKHSLLPPIAGEPLELFSGGHFNEAVRKAAERFEAIVRETSEMDASGQSLMSKAFGSKSGRLHVPGLQPENHDDFQEGFKFLAMGMMSAFRNVFSHGDEERRPPEECFEALLFLNWLFRCLDKIDQP